jgi:hypothetical protein
MAEQIPNNNQGPSLFSQIQQNLSKLAQPAQAPGQVTGQTEALQRISQAASGKAVPGAGMGTGPARSTQAELAVVDQVKRGQDELFKQNQMQQLALAQEQKSIQDQADFKNRLLSEDQLAARDKYLTTQERILNEYSNNQRQLDLNKDKARLEQLGFSMRLSNDKYLQELDRQARMANLSDAVAFEEEMYRTIFADEEELFRDNLDFRALMAADERSFRDEISQISLDMALDLSRAENKALSQKQMWDGIGGLMQAGAYGYAAFGEMPTSSIADGAGSGTNIPNLMPQDSIGPKFGSLPAPTPGPQPLIGPTLP